MRHAHPAALVVSDADGNIFEIPELRMAGMTLDRIAAPEAEDLIPLPYGSNLYMLPGHPAVGLDPATGQPVTVERYSGRPVFAAAAFMAPAYMQLFRAASGPGPDRAPLPLYSYTALGWRNGRFCVAGTRVDPDIRQDLAHVDLDRIGQAARALAHRLPDNRLVQHLMRLCVERYGCPAARNAALGRWECPIPTSPACNAACLGCLSHQPQETHVPASQDRIGFVPTPQEIAELVVPHLESAERAVASFGQGCEGEPLLVADTLEATIREVRKRTDRGVINLNTNASRPEAVDRLCRAGLQSIRVSLNSAQERYYDAYYKPRGYGFGDVLESICVARAHGIWVSLNYLVFPGFTDHPAETAALEQLIDGNPVDMIQTRNLNIDPDWYMDELELRGADGAPLGMRVWLDRVRRRFPGLKIGYFNPPREEMGDAAKMSPR